MMKKARSEKKDMKGEPHRVDELLQGFALSPSGKCVSGLRSPYRVRIDLFRKVQGHRGQVG